MQSNPNQLEDKKTKTHVKGHWFNSLLMKNKNFIIVCLYFQEYLGINPLRKQLSNFTSSIC